MDLRWSVKVFNPIILQLNSFFPCVERDMHVHVHSPYMRVPMRGVKLVWHDWLILARGGGGKGGAETKTIF